MTWTKTDAAAQAAAVSMKNTPAIMSSVVVK